MCQALHISHLTDIYFESPMNQSSFIGSEQCSSLNESTFSHVAPSKQDYQSVYQELSEMRITMRNLRQENKIIENTLQGTKDENSVLRQILANKKQIISQLNAEVASQRDEISRLQSELGHSHQAQDQDRIKIEEITRQKERMQEREIINQKRIHELSQRQSQKQTIVEKQQPLEQSVQMVEGSRQETSVKESIYQMEIEQKKQLIDALTSQISLYESQLKESKAKQEDQAEQIDKLTKKFKQLSQEKRSIVSEKQQKIQQLTKNKDSHDLMGKVNSRLLKILNSYFLTDHSETIGKLDPLIKDKQYLEAEAILDEITCLSEQANSQTLKTQLTEKKDRSLGRAYNQLSEEFGLLKLKHATLEREYKEVVQDNSRMLQYSKFQQMRNARSVYDPKISQTVALRKPHLTTSVIHDKQNNGTAFNQPNQ